MSGAGGNDGAPAATSGMTHSTTTTAATARLCRSGPPRLASRLIDYMPPSYTSDGRAGSMRRLTGFHVMTAGALPYGRAWSRTITLGSAKRTVTTMTARNEGACMPIARRSKASSAMRRSPFSAW